jgi:hypothetical protein
MLAYNNNMATTSTSTINKKNKKDTRFCYSCGSHTTSVHRWGKKHKDGTIPVFDHWFHNPANKDQWLCKSCRGRLYDSPAYKHRQELKKKEGSSR